MCTFLSWHNDEVFYTLESHQSKNLFGCVGLRKKQFCILNKQYDQQTYERLLAKIIPHMRETGEWGEYFAPELSYFGYNETVAQEYFPLTEDRARESGWNWSTSSGSGATTETLPVPQNRDFDPETIVGHTFTCEASGRGYRFNPLELEFYRKQQLLLPRLCPDERHFRRLRRRGMPKLWKRQCAESGEDIWSIFCSGQQGPCGEGRIVLAASNVDAEVYPAEDRLASALRPQGL